MRVKIIANNPSEDNDWSLSCSDISSYIGKEFEAIVEDDKVIAIVEENGHLLDVFEGEYEIIN